jgi:hypothetical protein
MSAADPAHTPPTVMNTRGDAAVIDITKRAGRRHTSQGRWKQMGDPAGPEPDATGPRPTGSQQTLAALAERFEETLNEHRLSLTDDKVAATYMVTLQIVRGLLDGAHAQGIVDEGQHGELAAMVEGVMGAPALVRAAE